MENRLVTGAATYRRKNGRTEWLIVKQQDTGGWELPKDNVRRAESSVRAAIRALADKAGIRGRVLEEAGRATVNTTVDGQPLDQKHIFYLMRQLSSEDSGSLYAEERWAPYSSARRSLSLAREKRILRQANDTLKLWRKAKKDL